MTTTIKKRKVTCLVCVFGLGLGTTQVLQRTGWYLSSRGNSFHKWWWCNSWSKWWRMTPSVSRARPASNSSPRGSTNWRKRPDVPWRCWPTIFRGMLATPSWRNTTVRSGCWNRPGMRPRSCKWRWGTFASSTPCPFFRCPCRPFPRPLVWPNWRKGISPTSSAPGPTKTTWGPYHPRRLTCPIAWASRAARTSSSGTLTKWHVGCCSISNRNSWPTASRTSNCSSKGVSPSSAISKPWRISTPSIKWPSLRHATAICAPTG